MSAPTLTELRRIQSAHGAHKRRGQDSAAIRASRQAMNAALIRYNVAKILGDDPDAISPAQRRAIAEELVGG